MKFDRSLTMVMPLALDVGQATVRSTPFTAAFFAANYLAIAKTFGRMHDEEMAATTAPRVAALVLGDIERELAGIGKGQAAPPSPIMNEIGRLTSIELPGGAGRIPWAQVRATGMLTAEDVSEVENALVFFTVALSMYPRSVGPTMVNSALSLWGASLESSGTPAATELVPSSQTSSAPASSGATAKPSSIPR